MSEKMSAICQPKYPQAYYCQQCTPNLFVNSTLLELLLLNQVIVFIVSAKCLQICRHSLSALLVPIDLKIDCVFYQYFAVADTIFFWNFSAFHCVW